IDSKILWKRARKAPGASEIVYPAPDRDDHTAFVKFATAAEALAAVGKLHNHVFKGARISAVIKKRVDGLVAGRKTGAPSRSSRLIIRNLPWHVTEEDLHRLFAPYGPVYSVTLPSAKPADDTHPSTNRHRGFAFVWMLAHADAERAIKGVNGRVVGVKESKKKTRKEREELAREKAARRLSKMRGEESDDKEETERDGEKEEEEEEKEGRVVAVDWALSKSKWEEAVLQRQGDEAMEVDGEEDGEEGGEGDHKSDEEPDEETSSESEESEASSDEDEDEDEDPHERPKLPNTDVGTTLFVRNVPFEATEDDVRTLFRVFGPLRYARITLDKETGRSRGTGFVCFWKREDADSAIEEAEAMAKELGTNLNPTKPHNPFSMSLLTPDPSASLAKRLVLHGRTLSVARAVARDEADRLREEGERSREKQDKRNLYLMREGGAYYFTSAVSYHQNKHKSVPASHIPQLPSSRPSICH
ncbi:RNA recognition motif-containing protein, partial [Ceratobasidium sp. 428]